MLAQGDEPKPICDACSKPISGHAPALFRHGRMFHVLSQARREQFLAMELTDQARKSRAEGLRLLAPLRNTRDRARLIAETRSRTEKTDPPSR